MIEAEERTPSVSQRARDAARCAQVLRDVLKVHVEDHLDAREIVVGWMEACIALARRMLPVSLFVPYV